MCYQFHYKRREADVITSGLLGTVDFLVSQGLFKQLPFGFLGIDPMIPAAIAVKSSPGRLARRDSHRIAKRASWYLYHIMSDFQL